MLALNSIAVQHIIRVRCQVGPVVFKTPRNQPCRKVVNVTAGLGLCIAHSGHLVKKSSATLRYLFSEIAAEFLEVSFLDQVLAWCASHRRHRQQCLGIDQAYHRLHLVIGLEQMLFASDGNHYCNLLMLQAAGRVLIDGAGEAAAVILI